jgi:chromosomal replication initiation ATPase DnaA
MKHDVFNQYVDRIVEFFSIDKEELFSKCKKRELVDARHLLYYLCFMRPMKKKYIENYMRDNGYSIRHHSIIHGIEVVKEKLKLDQDYVYVVKKLQDGVNI